MFQRGLFHIGCISLYSGCFCVQGSAVRTGEIAGAMIFHCAFPMAECCEVDFEKSGVSKSFSSPFTLSSEVALHTTICSRKNSLTLLWKTLDSVDEIHGDIDKPESVAKYTA
jgi:hypothetical protein